MKKRSRSLTRSRSSNALSRKRRRLGGAARVGVHAGEQRVGQREVRIELDRAPEMRMASTRGVIRPSSSASEYA